MVAKLLHDRVGIPLAVALVGVIALLGGCGESEQDLQSSTPASSLGASSSENPAASTESGYAPPDPSAESLRRMVEWQPFVIIGTVKSEETTYFLQGDIPYTVFTVSVVNEISTGYANEGSDVTMAVLGGKEPDGDFRPFQFPIKVGATYLLFLYDWANYIPGFPGVAGEASGKFRVSKDGLIVPNGSETYSGVREISGVAPEQTSTALASADPDSALEHLATVPLDEAIAKIRSAIAEAPLPAWPPPWSALYQNLPPATASAPTDGAPTAQPGESVAP